MPIALSVAGSDPSGGAGIQADLKTFHAHGVYGQAALSLWTVQNTRGVGGVYTLRATEVAAQLDALLEDMPPDAVKTGALGSAENVEALASRLSACSLPVVVDPVLVSSSGAAFGGDSLLEALRGRLLPIATLVTPNAGEARALTGVPVRDPESAAYAGERLLALGVGAALVTGGHFDGPPVDVLCTRRGVVQLPAERLPERDTHGTGCTLSAAITARLAAGRPLEQAVRGARAWLAEVMAHPLGLGQGRGPLNHMVPVRLG